MSAEQDATTDLAPEPSTIGIALTSDDSSSLLFRCLSLDLEVGVRDHRIHAFAGVRQDTGQSLIFPIAGDDLAAALVKLDKLADGADFLLGHNLIDFDLPHLQAVNPDLRLLRLPAVDTLRLNPLAFPRNPYHHLVKHYQDGQLKRGRINDPELDARLTLEVFDNQQKALCDAPSDLLIAWHWLTTADNGAGFDRVFASLRQLAKVVRRRGIRRDARTAGWQCLPDAHPARSWRMLSGAAGRWPMRWRGCRWLGAIRSCHPGCDISFPRQDIWCAGSATPPAPIPPAAGAGSGTTPARNLHAGSTLPASAQSRRTRPGGHLQQSIVEAAMAREHALAILPTGAGKSLCYQIPALSRYDKTGALTVVISPLVALMSDQVAGLEARGIGSCVTINGFLSMPERSDALDRVRLGDAGILIISPEQLRSVSVRRVLAQREIGAWVLDEAHCLSKWGHDFRPDYRYVGRFIREKAGNEPAPPVLCLTATAKPDVVGEIKGYFQKELGIELKDLRRRLSTRQPGICRGADEQRGKVRSYPPDPDNRFAYGWAGRGHRLLRHATACRRSRGVLAGKGSKGGPLSCGVAAGDQEERPGELHQWRSTGHSRHQRLWHGNRQAGRASGDPRRHPWFPGELPAGGGPRRAGPADSALRTALHPGRCGAAVRHVSPFSANAARNPWCPEGTMESGPEETLGRRGCGHRR